MGRPLKVAIVGGGVIGSSVAFWLKTLAEREVDVSVVERDGTYARASSSLSGSGIRVQFSNPMNIAISSYGIQFLRRAEELLAVDDVRPALGFRERGYLYLAGDDDQASRLRANNEAQRRAGLDIPLLDQEALASQFPWLNVADLTVGSFGLAAGEGWFDGPALQQAFRRKARALGVRYVAGNVVDFRRGHERVDGVLLEDGEEVACDVVVNAAGAWARSLAAKLDVDLPVFARRRDIFVLSCPDPLPGCPLIVDTSGFWMRPEGDRFLAGISPDAANDLDDAPLEVAHDSFDEELWPLLAARIPAFERLRVQGAWSGYYEVNTFDHNAILGKHPAWRNVVFANGFSGHGMQQSPAVGRGMAEFVLEGGYRSLDLSPLGFDRVLRNEPLPESNII